MRRATDGYRAASGARAAAGAAGEALEDTDAAPASATAWIVNCCVSFFGGIMSCLEALFGCGGQATPTRAQSPRLRRAPSQLSGARLLSDDALAPLEPPAVERLARPPTSPPSPRAVGLMTLEPPRTTEELQFAPPEKDDAGDEMDTTLAKKRAAAAAADVGEECPFCLEVRSASAAGVADDARSHVASLLACPLLTALNSAPLAAANTVTSLTDARSAPTQDFLTPDNPAMELGCGHRFHLPCLLAWENRSHACPCCGMRMRHPALD